MPLSPVSEAADGGISQLPKAVDSRRQLPVNPEKLLEWCKKVYGAPSFRQTDPGSPVSNHSDCRQPLAPANSYQPPQSSRCMTPSDVTMEDLGRHGLGELYRAAGTGQEVVVVFPSGSSAQQYVSSVPQRSDSQQAQMQLQQVLLPLLASCQEKPDATTEGYVCTIKYPPPSQQLHTVKACDRGTYRLSVDNMGCGVYESIEEALVASIKLRGGCSSQASVNAAAEIDLIGIFYNLKHDMYRLVWDGANLGLYESPRDALAVKMRIAGTKSVEGNAAVHNMYTARSDLKNRVDNCDTRDKGKSAAPKSKLACEAHYSDGSVADDQDAFHDQTMDLNSWPKQLLQAAGGSQRAGLCSSSAEALKVLSNAAQALVILGQAQAASPVTVNDSRGAMLPKPNQAAVAELQPAASQENTARPQLPLLSACADGKVPHLTIRLKPQSVEPSKSPLVKGSSMQPGRGADLKDEAPVGNADSRPVFAWPVGLATGDERIVRNAEGFSSLLCSQDVGADPGAKATSHFGGSLGGRAGGYAWATNSGEMQLRCKVKPVKNNKFELYVENRYFGIFADREAAESMAQQVHSMSWQDVWAFKEQRAACREASRHRKIEALAALGQRRTPEDSDVDDPLPVGSSLVGKVSDQPGIRSLLGNHTDGVWQPTSGHLLSHAVQGVDDVGRNDSSAAGGIVFGQVLTGGNPMDTDLNSVPPRKDLLRRLPCCMRLNRKLLKYELLVNGTYFALFNTRDEAEEARKAIRNMTWEEVCEYRKRFVRGKCRSKVAGQILVKPASAVGDALPADGQTSSQSPPSPTPAISEPHQDPVSASPAAEHANDRVSV